jgi:hypothetical protein
MILAPFLLGVAAVASAIGHMTLGGVGQGAAAMFSGLAAIDFDFSQWSLVGVELITLIFVIIFGFRPQPPLHQQYASKEDVEQNKEQEERHNREMWEVINGLRGAVSSIKTDVASIKTAREGNGQRLTEVSEEVREMRDKLNHLVGLIEGRTAPGARRHP